MEIGRLHSKVEFQECSASISDEDGNLLFYTNGISVFNAQGDTMQNGKNFNPGYFTDLFEYNGLPTAQACLILPSPVDVRQYYLFHQSVNQTGVGLRIMRLAYSVVDMSGDGGKGVVVVKNQTAITDTIGGGMLTATRHANGRDWWVTVVEANQSNIYVLLLDAGGLHPPARRPTHTLPWGLVGDSGGQAVFSPDGSRYAKWDNETKRLNVLDFDRCTGTFSNPLILTTPLIDLPDSTANPYGFYGLAFSPSGRLLYLNKNSHIEQYDLSAADVQASRQVVAVHDGFLDLYGPNAFATTFGFALSLAPDGKIYTNAMPCRYLNVIENPDVQGPGCNVSQHSVFLGFFNNYTLPVFPNYGLGALAGSGCDTLSSVAPPAWEAALSVYPNPANDRLHIEVPESGENECSLWDAMGKCVMSFGFDGKTEVSTQKLPDGIYYYRIMGGVKGQEWQGKVIIQH